MRAPTPEGLCVPERPRQDRNRASKTIAVLAVVVVAGLSACSAQPGDIYRTVKLPRKIDPDRRAPADHPE